MKKMFFSCALVAFFLLSSGLMMAQDKPVKKEEAKDELPVKREFPAKKESQPKEETEKKDAPKTSTETKKEETKETTPAKKN